MNAQEVLDLPDRQDELMQMFYPDLWKEMVTDYNITIICRRINNR